MLTLPTATPTAAAPSADLCPACHHLLAAHDVISVRWCAATSLGIGQRDCLCSHEVSDARVLRHY